jgi:hypothetical protein
MMNETAQYVCKNVQGCKFAYVQSDEISFVLTDFDTPTTDAFFGNRLCKMQSIIASLATSKFNQLMYTYYINKHDYKTCLIDYEDTLYRVSDVAERISELPMYQFDCKCWNVPSLNDVFAWFLYRQIDRVRNSKQQTAQTYLTHKQLMNKDTDSQVKLMLDEKGIEWNTYDDNKKYFFSCFTDYYFGNIKANRFVPLTLVINGNGGEKAEKKANAFKKKLSEFDDEATVRKCGLVCDMIDGAEEQAITYDDLDEETRDNIDMGLIELEDAIKSLGGTMYGQRITEYRVKSLARNSAKGSEATVYSEDDLGKLPIVTDEPKTDVDIFDDEDI